MEEGQNALSQKYENIPIYGYIPRERMRFDDKDYFPGNLNHYGVLKTIRLWLGTPKVTSENEPKEKCVLGIQAVYENLQTGKVIESDQHCGDITGNDVEKKELTLTEGDYFTKFYISVDTCVFYLKFETKRQKVLEVGQAKQEHSKTIEINTSREPHMIQCFVGYYNQSGLKALGFQHIAKKNFIFIHFVGVLRLRHLLKTNIDARTKWSDPGQQKMLDESFRAVCMACLLPDNQFSNVMKYCV